MLVNAALGCSIGLGFWGDEISKGLNHESSRICFWWKSLVIYVGMKRYLGLVNMVVSLCI